LLYERARQTTPPQKTKQKKVSKNAKKTSAPAIFPNYYSRVSIFLPSVYGKCRQLIQIILPYLLKQKKPLLITFVLVLVISGITFWFFQKKDVVVSVQETIKNETPTLSNKEVPVSNILKSESTFTLNKELAGITFLSNQAYGATLKGIIDLESKEEFVIPDIKGEVRFLTPMEDLGLIFILSSQNELFAWSPLNKSFTKNDLTLPENARVTGVGTYLTYLYVLDRGNNQLYRYPRAENGFRDATPWMKESFELTDTAFLAINETIALSPSREHLLSFSQGKNTGTFTLKDPQSPMAIKALTTNSDSPFLYALDANSNLSVWNLDRTLLHTYTLNDTPKDYQFLTVDPEKNTLLVGNKEGNITRYINVESE
jgi:hypothetical protein